jgi:hypothetical protein
VPCPRPARSREADLPESRRLAALPAPMPRHPALLLMGWRLESAADCGRSVACQIAMATSAVRVPYLWRLVGAVVLDGDVYEEIEADRSATPYAFVTVTIAGMAAGIGLSGGTGSPATVARIAGLVLLSWAVWAVLMFEIGARVLHRPETRTDVGELLRTSGFATAPGWFLVLGVAPDFTTPVILVVAVWLLAAMTVAVRQALDFDSTLRAAAVCAMGWGLVLMMAFILSALFEPALAAYRASA